MSDNRKRKFSKVYVTPKFAVNDLVKVEGYGETVFQVDGYTLEGYRGPDVNSDYIVYDMTGVVTGDWIVADQEDLTLVSKAKDAEQFLDDNELENQQSYFADLNVMDIVFIDNTQGGGQVEKPVVSKHREREKSEIKRRKDYRKRVEKMLDQYNHLVKVSQIDEAIALMNRIKLEGVIFGAGGFVDDGSQE